jgi:hypothetical protein
MTTMKKIFSLAALLVTTLATAQTQWYEIPSNSTSGLNSIDFPSESVGYIAGKDGVMLKSTNGGETWTPINYTGIQVPVGVPEFVDIDFVDEQTGFVVIANFGGFYKTIDGGLNWTGESGANMCFPHCVYPEDATNFIVGGVDCFQGAMIDVVSPSGWTAATMNFDNFNTSEFVKELDFFGNVGLGAVNGPYLIRTADGGATWDSIPTGLSELGYHTSVHFVDASTCYAGYSDNGGGFGILVSTDAGLTWQQDINSATFFYPTFLSVTSAANGDVYSGAKPSGWPNQGLIFEYDGAMWTYSNVAQPINDMFSYGTDVTFGVGDSGLIVVNVPVSTLGIKQKTVDDIPILYANPTKDWLYFNHTFDTPASVQIYDLHGAECQVEVQCTGTSCALNLSALPSGLYVLALSDGQRTHHQRIVKE